ncbi:DUF3095 family protein [Neolewinella persica]|uniref:DUF3095 family protein n=1 Tax=Neolewinella persica TaxID=70998 RepID=UPI0003823822|nr:DUF3095 family protein [Neolewinella persica]
MLNPTFYQDLPVENMPLRKLLGKRKLFHAVPANWQVIVIDIIGSTQAVAAGRHHEVNLAATGGIITVLNRLKADYNELKIPYFFGGDGATFIAPPKLAEELVSDLNNYRHHISNQMDLVLRVGSMQVAEVYDGGTSIQIAVARLSRLYVVPVVLGNGLKEAERRIKASFTDAEAVASELAIPDLTGMECRWNEIKPPRDKERIVCLLVSCNDEANQGRVYGEVMGQLDKIFGQLERRRPVASGRLRLNLGLVNLAREMYASLGHFQLRYLLRNWLATLYGPYYFQQTVAGKNYLAKISQLTDTLMLDGNINTVISGTGDQIDQLTRYLEKQESAGALIFGMHVTHASVMSCYVRDHDEDHVHFVDGTEGGYTSAARMFKAKLRARG